MSKECTAKAKLNIWKLSITRIKYNRFHMENKYLSIIHKEENFGKKKMGLWNSHFKYLLFLFDRFKKTLFSILKKKMCTAILNFSEQLLLISLICDKALNNLTFNSEYMVLFLHRLRTIIPFKFPLGPQLPKCATFHCNKY